MRPQRFLSTLVVLAAMISLGRPVIAADDPFPLGPDSQKQEGVPEGKITQHTWTSKIFEGTTRDYYVYVPAQYDGSQSAAVMVFQDVDTPMSIRPAAFESLSSSIT